MTSLRAGHIIALIQIALLSSHEYFSRESIRHISEHFPATRIVRAVPSQRTQLVQKSVTMRVDLTSAVFFSAS